MPFTLPATVSAGQVITPTWGNSIRTALQELQGVWTPYIPVLGGAGWALGSSGALAEGHYLKVGGTVWFLARLVFGTAGATFGAANPTVTLPPFAPTTLYQQGDVRVPEVMYYDNTGGIYRGRIVFGPSVCTPLVSFRQPTSDYIQDLNVSSGAPFVWAASDRMTVVSMYETAF